MGPQEAVHDPKDLSATVHSASTELVVSPRECYDRSVSNPFQGRDDHVHGCLDRSLEGWGAQLDSATASGIWPPFCYF